jgi:ferredoxin
MIQIDSEKCQGCGTCAALYPSCIKMNDAGKAEVTNAECADCNHDEVVACCAFGAISKQ